MGRCGKELDGFNEPVLTPMTGRVSDGKLMCLRAKVRVCVHNGIPGNLCVFVCYPMRIP